MLHIEPFSKVMREEGIDFLTGVPCSYLKSFVSYANASGRIPYSVASSEGEAIGIAAGAWLGGRMPMVLIQNSGLGNCVNPLTSLSLTFDLPLVLMVSHRGQGPKDAPQHRVMGAITYALLETMGIEAHTMPPEQEEAHDLLRRLRRTAAQRLRPVAVVVPKGTFEPYAYTEKLTPKTPKTPTEPDASAAPERLAPRVEALQAIAGALAPDDLVIATTGMTSRELFTVGDRPANFYMMGSMGCAPAIALGLALCRPQRKVIVLDGDGAFMMKMGTATTIGHYRPQGILHLLLDNGTYETTGGQPTASPTVDFERVALAAGYRRAVTARDPADLSRLVSDFRVGDGPVLGVLPILDGHLPDVPRVEPRPQQIRDRFREAAREHVCV